jgi:hypothetical protein
MITLSDCQSYAAAGMIQRSLAFSNFAFLIVSGRYDGLWHVADSNLYCPATYTMTFGQ